MLRGVSLHTQPSVDRGNTSLGRSILLRTSYLAAGHNEAMYSGNSRTLVALR